MNKLIAFEQAILQVYEEYAAYLSSSNESAIDYQLIINSKNKHFQ